MKFLHGDAQHKSAPYQDLKIGILKIQDGKRPLVWKKLTSHIFAAILAIGMKFCMVMHSTSLHPTKSFRNASWQMAGILKHLKLLYLLSRLSDCDEILHGDAWRHSAPYQSWKLEFCKCKMADSHHVQKCKIAISPQTFKLLQLNFVQCHMATHCTAAYQQLKIRI